MAELAKNILGYLDSDSLRSAEQVEKGKILFSNNFQGMQKLAQRHKQRYAVEVLCRESSQAELAVERSLRTSRLVQISIPRLSCR